MTSLMAEIAAITPWSWSRSSHLHREVVQPLAVLGDRHLGLHDVGLARGDRRRDVGEETGPVAPDVHGDLHGQGLLVDGRPLHGHRPLAVDDARGEVRTVPGVHGDPAPSGDEAHDRVARHRTAALREPHEDIVDALDRDAARLRPRADRLRGLRLGSGVAPAPPSGEIARPRWTRRACRSRVRRAGRRPWCIRARRRASGAPRPRGSWPAALGASSLRGRGARGRARANGPAPRSGATASPSIERGST